MAGASTGSWVHLSVDLPAACEERFSAAVAPLVPSGFSFEIPPARPAPGGPAVGQIRAHIYVRPEAGDEIQAGVALALRTLPGLDPLPEIRFERIVDPGWAEAWKAHFGVQHVGRRLVVQPSWREYEARPGDCVVHLDPGCAFGSGGHATTRQALEFTERLIDAAAPRLQSLLDVGCGSGIIAIAGALLGAEPVTALDVDPDSVVASAENAERNGVRERVTVRADPLSALETAHDIVVANILSHVLLSLRPDLLRLVRPGGHLILAGILVTEEAEFRRAFERSAALTCIGRDDRDGWLGLCYRLEDPS